MPVANHTRGVVTCVVKRAVSLENRVVVLVHQGRLGR
jgi:hypothetical protein